PGRWAGSAPWPGTGASCTRGPTRAACRATRWAGSGSRSRPRGAEGPDPAGRAGPASVAVVGRHGDAGEPRLGQQVRELAQAPVLQPEQLQLGGGQHAVVPFLVAQPPGRTRCGAPAASTGTARTASAASARGRSRAPAPAAGPGPPAAARPARGT